MCVMCSLLIFCNIGIDREIITAAGWEQNAGPKVEIYFSCKKEQFAYVY